MPRYFTPRKHDFPILRELALPVLFFALIVGGLLQGLQSVSASVERQELRSAQLAVRHAAVQCYALEGRYPQSVDYLVERYGLAVDQRRYVIHYQPIGSNLMPDISVFPIGQPQP